MKLLNWTGLGLLGVAGRDGKAHALKPGLNEVEDAHFEQMCLDKGFMHRLEDGSLELVEPKKDGAKPVTALTEMKTKKAVELVSETIDESILKAWSKAEKRSEVKDAIKAQLEKLGAPAVYRDKKPA